MGPLNIADKLKAQADDLLFGRNLDGLLRSYGTVSYTGSYLLNLMAWRDIDIHLILEPNAESLERFWELGLQLAQLDGVYLANFLNTHRHPKKGLPAGFYWGVKLDTGCGAIWKIDIWATDQSHLKRNRLSMERVASALTDDTRHRILDVKHALMLPEGCTPGMSGFHIYEAVLFKRLPDLDAIRGYLREQGVAGV